MLSRPKQLTRKQQVTTLAKKDMKYTILKNNTLVSIQYFRVSIFIKVDNLIKADNL